MPHPPVGAFTVFVCPADGRGGNPAGLFLAAKACFIPRNNPVNGGLEGGRPCHGPKEGVKAFDPPEKSPQVSDLNGVWAQRSQLPRPWEHVLRGASDFSEDFCVPISRGWEVPPASAPPDLLNEVRASVTRRIRSSLSCCRSLYVAYIETDSDRSDRVDSRATVWFEPTGRLASGVQIVVAVFSIYIDRDRAWCGVFCVCGWFACFQGWIQWHTCSNR